MPLNKTVSSTVVMVLALGTSFGVAGLQPASAADVKTLEGFSDWRKPGPTTVDRPLQILSDTLLNFPESLEGRPGFILKVDVNADDQLVIEYLDQSGGDDSVGDSNKRFIFVQNAEYKFDLIAYGYRQKCLRGDNPGVWTDKSCP